MTKPTSNPRSMPAIVEATADDPRVIALIEAHRAFCRAHTPDGSGHAIAASSPDTLRIRYWLATSGGQAVGCIGLKALEEHHGEIKTLHVLDKARGQGTGERLLTVLIDAAARSGLRRLSLETGSSGGFAASRRLYERHGFTACPAFGPYVDDPFSYCMTLRL